MDSADNQSIKLGARKYVFRAALAPVFMGALFFVAAGTIYHPRAWLYYTIFLFLSIFVNGLLYFKTPELLYHRSKTKSDAKGWDKWLMPVAVLTGFHFQSIVMGLEARFIDTSFNAIIFILGWVLYSCSYYITAKAMLVNDHFEAYVRIQNDRDHKVISSGPYNIVRHPGYLAFILASFAIPMIIGSVYGLINSLVASLLILIRTYKEDQMLKHELEGYKSYSEKVKYRIIPGIW